MENAAAKMTKAFFEAQGCHVDVVGDESEVLLAGFNMKNCASLRVAMIFDDDSSSAQLKSIDFVKVPEDKKTAMYEVCNELNNQYRWIKFCIDNERGVIVASDDAVIQLDSCGDEMMRCCFQLVGICDQAYPVIMKAIFS